MDGIGFFDYKTYNGRELIGAPGSFEGEEEHVLHEVDELRAGHGFVADDLLKVHVRQVRR